MSKSNPMHSGIFLTMEKEMEDHDAREWIRHQLMDSWSLPDSWKTYDRMESYFLLQWDYEYFLSQLCAITGQPGLTRDGISYTVILHRCKMDEIRHCKLWLSFRKRKDSPFAYVLVKPVKESNNGPI